MVKLLLYVLAHWPAGYWHSRQIKNPENEFSGFFERLAATYSRGSYTTTTIGHAVFDGRVRNGNGSDHCGIATKLVCTLSWAYKILFKKIVTGTFGDSLKTIHRSHRVFHNSRVEIADLK